MSGVEHFDCKSRAPVASHLVVIAFSAAGLQPLETILRVLTPAFPASVILVHHARAVTDLPTILQYRLPLQVEFAKTGSVLRSGTVLVCPAGHHIFVNPDRTVGLSVAHRVPGWRPADWLFESAAAVFGDCGVAVVLSGRLFDGARGVPWIRRSGGRVIAQNPSTCGYPSMPTAAIATGCVDFVLDPEAIGLTLHQLVGRGNAKALLREWEDPFAGLM